MSATEIVKELKALPRPERVDAIKLVLETLCSNSKTVERIMRRIENADVPEDVWRGIEDAENERFVDMEIALHEKPTKR